MGTYLNPGNSGFARILQSCFQKGRYKSKYLENKGFQGTKQQFFSVPL